MLKLLLMSLLLFCSIASATAQVYIGLPGVSIGFDLPAYPQLVAVPNYPVYYAPSVNSNYFFYDGMYWVYQSDNWYASSWYNGPWASVAPEAVPVFILRVPVRYYRHPPAYFHGWRSDAAPRWDQHWGNSWAQARTGWDTWNHASVPTRAPLPVYQQQYSGSRYPGAEQQQALQTQNYHYQPQAAVVQQHSQAQPVASAPAPQVKQAAPRERTSPQQDQRVARPPSSPQQGVATAPERQQTQAKASGDAQQHAAKAPPQRSGPAAQPQGQQPQQAAVRAGPKTQPQGQQPQQAAAQREQAKQRQEKGAQQAKAPAQEPKAQPEAQQPKQGALQPRVQTARVEGQDKAPLGKAPAREEKQEQEKPEQQGERK
jgi:hypothetical protein